MIGLSGIVFLIILEGPLRIISFYCVVRLPKQILVKQILLVFLFNVAGYKEFLQVACGTSMVVLEDVKW